MPDFYEVLKTRRSVRAYLDKPVDEKKLKEVIDLATFAPSGGNRQPWTFTVVTDKGLMSRLNDRVKAIMKESQDECFMGRASNPDYDVFYDAPALTVISADTRVLTAMIDCQLAAENLFLAAHAKGLGTCYIGFVLLGRDDPEVRGLLRIPESHGLMAAAITGYPAVTPSAPQRNPAQIEWMR
jgi:nitroreductase